MEISRRSFGKMAIVLAAGIPTFMTGCGIFSDILAWTNVAGVAFDGIVRALGAFLPPGGLVAINAIKIFLQDLAGAVTEYQNDTNPADKATLLEKIRTLLGDIAANFQTFLSQLNLGNNPIVAVVLGLAQVILAAIGGFLGQLPAPTTPIVQAKIAAVSVPGYPPLTVTPKYYKRVQDFKSDYNAVCISYGHTEWEIR
jgi:hypothetical protein